MADNSSTPLFRGRPKLLVNNPENYPRKRVRFGGIRINPAYKDLILRLMERVEAEDFSDLVVLAARDEGLALTGIKEVPTWTTAPRFTIRFGRPPTEQTT